MVQALVSKAAHASAGLPISADRNFVVKFRQPLGASEEQQQQQQLNANELANPRAREQLKVRVRVNFASLIGNFAANIQQYDKTKFQRTAANFLMASGGPKAQRSR